MPTRLFRIVGHVQGVFFRARTKELTDRLGICGWVRNSRDGSVEIHAEGADAALTELESWCHRGPAAAQVESVDVQEEPDEHCVSFEIRD